MPEHGHENSIGIARVHQNRGDLLAVAQTEMPPGLAAVGGFVHPVAHRKIRPLHSFAAAGVNDVRIGRSNRERADGAGGLVIEDRMPGAADIVRLPNAAVVRSHIEHIGLRGDARGGHGAAAAKRPDRPPAQAGKIGCEGLRNQRRATLSRMRLVSRCTEIEFSMAGKTVSGFSFLVSGYRQFGNEERETRNEEPPWPPFSSSPSPIWCSPSGGSRAFASTAPARPSSAPV